MSIHRSLRTAGGKTGIQRNVLKRFERVQKLMTEGRWTADRSIFGLPKTKMERVKVRKAASAEDATAKEAAAKGAEPGATPPSKSPAAS